MILDLSNDVDRMQLAKKLEVYLKEQNRIELKLVREKRSIRQNSYLHICIALFGIEFGYTIDESKTLLKRECPFMIYEKQNKKFLKKTSEMDSKELTDFIDWIRNYAGMQGLHIPDADQYLHNQHEIDKQISNHKTYL